MTHVTTAIFVAKAASLFFGGLITYLSAKAYGRTGTRPLKYLSVGFGIVTVGAATAGTLDMFLSAALETSLLVESAVTAVGFAVITYSLYLE